MFSQNHSYFTPAGEILLRSQPNTSPDAAKTMLFGLREPLVKQVCKIKNNIVIFFEMTYSKNMKVLLYGKNAENISSLLPKFGLAEVKENPEVIVCYGGDGTYLLAEAGYPGIPKVMIRDSKICKKCVNLPIEEILKRLADGHFIENSVIKLDAIYAGKKYTVVNDVVIAHTTPTSAIRYKIYINSIPYIDGREIVGDGIVVATPFGSGAYYRSITDGVFSVGIGLAFNNSTEQVDHIILKETDEIRFELTRGQAVLALPGHEPDKISAGDSVVIKTSKERGKILTFGEEFSYWAN